MLKVFWRPSFFIILAELALNPILLLRQVVFCTYTLFGTLKIHYHYGRVVIEERDDPPDRGSAVAQWWSVGLRSERSGVRDLPPPCCVLEQDTLLPESTG